MIEILQVFVPSFFLAFGYWWGYKRGRRKEWMRWEAYFLTEEAMRDGKLGKG